jgi:uncharacterized protein YcbK (DUF882 family)
MSNVTPHFKVGEFARPARPARGFPAAAPYPAAWVSARLRPLCEALEVLRTELGGKSIKIGSGYRDPDYNRAIGGARASQHMQGRAADITVAGVTPKRVHDTLLRLHQEGRIRIGGLGSYPGFTHVDVRPGTRLARWTGSRDDQ